MYRLDERGWVGGGWVMIIGGWERVPVGKRRKAQWMKIGTRVKFRTGVASAASVR